jgi:hypothetical protein
MHLEKETVSGKIQKLKFISLWQNLCLLIKKKWSFQNEKKNQKQTNQKYNPLAINKYLLIGIQPWTLQRKSIM